MSQTEILEYAKTLILAKAGINHLSPSDCKLISMSIQDETQKYISETTLKRLFGFAKVKNSFSQYTINTILEYVERAEHHASDNNFKAENRLSKSFSDLLTSTNNATENTLTTIKNRLTIPFEYTVTRSFIEFDYDFFYDNNYSFYALISHASFGKSTCLCHLMQHLLDQKDKKYKNDVLLFVRAEDLQMLQNNPLSIEAKIKSKLGLNEKINLLLYLKELNRKYGTKFILAIDGISEIANSETKPLIFDKLLTLISNLGDPKFIKIILSIRTSSWNRLYTLFKNLPTINERWYNGSYFNAKDHSNIPQFSSQEIEQILKKIHKDDSFQVDKQLTEKLKYPPYLQWYYLIKDDFNVADSGTDIIAYEIANRFIKERVYSTTYATEKITICRKIVALSAISSSNQSTAKSKLIQEISIFKNAYQQLIADGVCTEEKIAVGDSITEYITFVHPHIFEYFLFTELLERNNNSIDLSYFEEARKFGVRGKAYCQLILWTTRYLISKSDFKGLQNIFKIDLLKEEQTYLLYFITQILSNNKILKLFRSKEEELEFHKLMMEQIVHFDFANHYYIKILKALLNISKSPNYSLLYHISLAIYECLQLDKKALGTRLLAIKELKIEDENWKINPYEILLSIYHTMTGERIREKATLYDMDIFLHHKNSFTANDSETSVEEILNLSVVLIYNSLNGKHIEHNSLAATFFAQHPKLLSSKNRHSEFILALINYAKGGYSPPHHLTDFIDKVEKKTATNKSNGSTTFIQAINFLAKAYSNKSAKFYKAAIKNANECLKICKAANIELGLLIIYQLKAEIYAEIGAIDRRNDCLNKKLNIILKKELDKSNFQSIGN